MPQDGPVPLADPSSGRGPPLGSLERVRRLRVLSITSLFPSSANQRHGIFVETRLLKLSAASPVVVDVIAPVPWFPSRMGVFGRYAKWAAVPRRETRQSLNVLHPRYLMIPRFGMGIQPFTYAFSVLRELRVSRLFDSCHDVVDAHYLYPDGVAAALVARRLGLPLVLTARGSDVNLIARMAAPCRAILRSTRQAVSVIAVSEALKQALCDIGVESEKVVVLRNGVDTKVFQPADRMSTRARLEVGTDTLVLSVGNLVQEKGHDIVIGSVAQLPNARLVIVGEGPERHALESLAVRLGVATRVTFLPNMSQRELAAVYGAADVLALGSAREGWPNVLLEAMACGTPVVAMDVGGVREIVREEVAGRIVIDRSAHSMAEAIRKVTGGARREEQRVSYAKAFDWDSIALQYFDLLSKAAGLDPGDGEVRFCAGARTSCERSDA